MKQEGHGGAGKKLRRRFFEANFEANLKRIRPALCLCG